ncbi:hypothetical protein ABZ345_14200 [Lentzea sp. NPDC005914]|uniref:hypothetical protein n=1 Tax=Lentzea sp. NPDC005914 TaxID=3154572 RepID=UPI0033C8E1E2
MCHVGDDNDVYLSGLLFYDLVFTGLPKPPRPGEELWTGGMASGPGGIANFAVALARLGTRPVLAAAFGDDAHGTLCWTSSRTKASTSPGPVALRTGRRR